MVGAQVRVGPVDVARARSALQGIMAEAPIRSDPIRSDPIRSDLIRGLSSQLAGKQAGKPVANPHPDLFADMALPLDESAIV